MFKSFLTIIASFSLLNISSQSIIRSTNRSELEQNDLNSNEDTLVFAHVLYRHGARNIKAKTYENDPYKDAEFWPEGFAQMVRNREFSLFDYESKRTNMRMYGRETPPSYNLTQITAPVNLYFSKDDDTATMMDAIQLQSQLPNHKSSYLIPIDDFRHIDFTYSRYVRQAVNDRLIHNMNVTNRL